jgi:hypothetical protein
MINKKFLNIFKSNNQILYKRSASQVKDLVGELK